MSREADMPRDAIELEAALSRLGLQSAEIHALVSAALPAAILRREPRRDDEIPRGASKFGGAPDLPEHLPWPERPPVADASQFAEIHLHRTRRARDAARAKHLVGYRSREDAEAEAAAHERRARDAARAFPLAFVCQIDVAALRTAAVLDKVMDEGLPNTGRLLFFYDFWQGPPGYEPSSKVCWRVIHDTLPATHTVRRAPPQALYEIDEIDAHCGVLASAFFSYAPVFSPPVPEDLRFPAEALSARSLKRYEDWIEGFAPGSVDGRDNHQFGGRARFCQGTAQMSAQSAFHGVRLGSTNYETAETEAAAAWRCLLQLGTDSVLGQCPTGMLVFFMRETDLGSGRFGNVWADYACD
ncbi:MAG: DUF1963 domain-containing protein [Pseudomonadota bacterium]